jgi:hypothetical protein
LYEDLSQKKNKKNEKNEKKMKKGKRKWMLPEFAVF